MPQSFALTAWWENGVLVGVGSNRAVYVTLAEIAANTLGNGKNWRGRYYPTDTRDVVCCQEALLAAYAPDTANGQYRWDGRNSCPRVWFGNGVYKFNRKLWLGSVDGAHLSAASMSGARFVGIMPDESVFWADGIHAFTFDGIQTDTQPEYNGAHLGLHYSNPNAYNQRMGPGWFTSHVYKPAADIDWIGEGTVVGFPPLGRSDYTPRTVTDAQMPYADVSGYVGTPNAMRGRYLVVIKDDGNHRAIYQARRIMWDNGAGRFYIAGRWDFPPTNLAQIVLAPQWFSWAKWHGDSRGGAAPSTLSDWFVDFTTLTTDPVGQTLLRFDSPDDFGGVGLLTRTITAKAQDTLTISPAWPAGLGCPLPNDSDDPGRSRLGASGHWEPAQPFFPVANYTIGGTVYNVVASANDNNVTVQGTPYIENNHFVGAYAEVSTSSAEATGLVSNGTGSDANGYPTVQVLGANRTPGLDVGMQVHVRSGSGIGQMATVIANTADTFSLDTGIDGNAGVVIDLLDPAVGQILPIASNTTSQLETIYYPGSGTQVVYPWTKLPRAGSTIIIHPRLSNINLQGGTFHRCAFATQAGDAGLAWAKSGDLSQGSETTFEGCSVSALRLPYLANGLNVINMHWKAGSVGATRHAGIFNARGWMNVTGPGIGVPTDSRLGPMQLGAAIVMGDGSAPGQSLKDCYIEGAMLFNGNSPTLLERCDIAQPVNGQRTLNRTWRPGDLWIPKYSFGRCYRCVDVFGTGSTSAIADPSFTLPGGIETPVDDYNGGQVVRFLDGSGNGATFVRQDWQGVGGAGQIAISGGTYGAVCVGSTGESGATYIGGGAVLGRTDFLAGSVGVNDLIERGGLFIDSSVLVATSAVADSTYVRNPMPYQGVLQAVDPSWGVKFNAMLSAARALMLVVSTGGTGIPLGLAELLPTEFGLTPGGGNSAVMLAIIDFLRKSDGSSFHGWVQKAALLGRMTLTSQDVPGIPQRIGGGQGNGLGRGGPIDLEVSPPSAVSGATPNTHVVVGRFDDSVTAGDTRFLVYDVTRGTLSRVTVGAADSGGVGFKVLRVAN